MTNEGQFPKVDGDTLYASEVNPMYYGTKGIIKQQLQQNINILINSEASATNLGQYDTMISDRFINANGQLNTVDTANTTAGFSSKTYHSVYGGIPSVDLVDMSQAIDSSWVQSNSGHGTVVWDVNSTVSNAFYGKSQASSSYPSNETANISQTNKGIDLSGREVIIKFDYSSSYTPGKTTTHHTIRLTDGTNYIPLWTVTESTNTNYAIKIKVNSQNILWYLSTDGGTTYGPENSVNNSLSVSYLNFKLDTTYNDSAGYYASTATITIYSILYNNETINTTIQTKPQTIDSGVKQVQIYSDNEIIGTGNILVDVSLDGGTTYTSGIPLDTISSIISSDGNNLVMKLNLNCSGVGNKISIYDYSIMLI